MFLCELFEPAKLPWVNESKRSVLYHGTSIEALANILADGHVNASPPDDYDNGYDGVSLTSSLAVAKKFAQEAKDRDEYWNSPVNDEVVLVFNADAIRKTIGASRVTWDGSRQEREHRTHGPIINVLKYLIQIRLDVNSLQWWINAFEEEGETRLATALKSIPTNLVKNRVNERAKVNITETGNFNIISTPDIIKYIRKNHGEKLHQDYVDHLNTFSGFVLKDIPVNSINANLPHLDKTKVEQYKQLDFSKSPPIVMGDGHILDGYHRVNVAKTLKIPTIKGYVGMKKTSNITENADPKTIYRMGKCDIMAVALHPPFQKL